MSKTSFLLTKWYLDCVTDSGDAVILYLADLRWNALKIHYENLVTLLRGRVSSTSSLRGHATPTIQNTNITVQLSHLGVEGNWQAMRSPILRTIFDSEHGSVDWHCLQPMSQVDLLLHGTTRLTGHGYAECLSVSVLPWKLPLHELRWGRFVSERDALVWIDWQGPRPYRLVYQNGEERQVGSITDSEIAFGDGFSRLELDCGLVLRQGQLGDTVFPGVSSLVHLLPRSMLSIDECKWRSRGVMRVADETSSGWAIHEIVRWSAG